jgi:hypothetical protein
MLVTSPSPTHTLLSSSHCSLASPSLLACLHVCMHIFQSSTPLMKKANKPAQFVSGFFIAAFVLPRLCLLHAFQSFTPLIKQASKLNWFLDLSSRPLFCHACACSATLCMFLFSSFWLRRGLMTPARNSGRW